MVPAAIPTDGYGDTLTKPGEPVLPPGTDGGESAITRQEGPGYQPLETSHTDIRSYKGAGLKGIPIYCESGG